MRIIPLIQRFFGTKPLLLIRLRSFSKARFSKPKTEVECVCCPSSVENVTWDLWMGKDPSFFSCLKPIIRPNKKISKKRISTNHFLLVESRINVMI